MDGLLSVTAKDIRKCCWRNEDLYIEEVVLKKPDLEKRNRNLLNINTEDIICILRILF